MSDAALRAYYNERAPVYDHAYSGTAPAWVDAMAADLRAALADRHGSRSSPPTRTGSTSSLPARSSSSATTS